MKIKIRISDKIESEATFNHSLTAKKIYQALPIKGKVALWGDEIYFPIPVECELEEDYKKEVVQIGDLCYWPSGRCFCIFFGKTPISDDDNIKPASAVTLVGNVENPKEFKRAEEGDNIVIEKI